MFYIIFFDLYFYNFIFSNWIIWRTFRILIKGFFWKAGYTRILYPPVKFLQFSYIRIGIELRLLADLYLKDNRESLHKYNIDMRILRGFSLHRMNPRKILDALRVTECIKKSEY